MLPMSATCPCVNPMYRTVVGLLTGKSAAPGMTLIAERPAQSFSIGSGPKLPLTPATRFCGGVAACCARAVLARDANVMAEIRKVGRAFLESFLMALCTVSATRRFCGLAARGSCPFLLVGYNRAHGQFAFSPWGGTADRCSKHPSAPNHNSPVKEANHGSIQFISTPKKGPRVRRTGTRPSLLVRGGHYGAGPGQRQGEVGAQRQRVGALRQGGRDSITTRKRKRSRR